MSASCTAHQCRVSASPGTPGSWRQGLQGNVHMDAAPRLACRSQTTLLTLRTCCFSACGLHVFAVTQVSSRHTCLVMSAREVCRAATSSLIRAAYSASSHEYGGSMPSCALRTSSKHWGFSAWWRRHEACIKYHFVIIRLDVELPRHRITEQNCDRGLGGASAALPSGFEFEFRGLDMNIAGPGGASAARPPARCGMRSAP